MTTPLAAPRRPAKMPTSHPKILHLMPYLLGDSLRALRIARRLGIRYVDQNGHSDAEGVVWVIHWHDLREYRWVWTGRYDSKGREVRRPADKRLIEKMPTQEVARRRSAQYGGRRPHTAEAHMAEAKAQGRILCLEVKGSPQFLVDAPWDYLAGAAVRTRAVVIIMTLQNIPGAAGRLRKALSHGFAAALLPRGPRPRWWTELRDQGVQLWGRWRHR